MVEIGKYKVSNLAKDLKLKNKDVTDLLEKNGFPGRTHSSVLSADEYSFLMNYYMTQNQIVDINSYMDKKTQIVDSSIVKLVKVPEAPKATAKPAPKAEQVKAEQPKAEPSKAEKPTAKETPKTAQETKKAAPSTEQKPEQKPEQKIAEQKTEQKVQKKPHVQEQRKNPADRFANLPAKKEEKPAKKEEKPAKDKKDRPQTLQRNVKTTTEVTTSTDAVTSGYTGNKSGTRVVDTRASNVDLSKYDERLDHLASNDKAAGGKSSGFDSNRQKLKKQNNNNQKGGKPEWNKGGKQQGKNKKDAPKPTKQPVNVTIPEEISVGELASRLKVTAAEVIKRLMMLGVMASVNQIIDYDTAEYVATELGANVSKEVVVTIEDKLFDDSEDAEETLVERAPVVCVMGHVDHGKTSILDSIRHANVTAGEAGGITQHIGAYRVNIDGKDITFLDTPGHEAFTAMRARGAMATDIAILVVAADDGIMPQTIEAINHAKAANIDIIVAINKMDKFGADPDRIKQEMTQYGLVPEEWGGDAICVPVSALTGMGIPELLENVLLVAEVKGLRANPNRRAKGIVIEARLDKGRGPVATVLVQNGTLKTSDVVIAGTSVGHVRAMTNDKGQQLKTAGPSVHVEIIGLSEVPEAGDEFAAVEDERMARELVEKRKQELKEAEFRANAKVSLDALFAQINDGVKELKIIVKADVGGSAEAVKASLLKLSNEEVKVSVIHSAVGGITEGDVMLAAASNAIIVGFNVRPDRGAMDSAERQKVDIRTYRIIYECIEEIEAAMKGMLAPKFKESLLGHAEVRQTIRVPNVGTIAGSYITDGKINRNAQIRVVRDGIVIFEDKISSLRRFKDDVKEVAQGYECGIGLDRFNDIKEGDILEAFEMVQI
ncbi:MAG: translation initiation factor IF-2 [Clostridia bacterium]|nr:translation initiation factor IF-2 [Clostridia bacterium]